MGPQVFDRFTERARRSIFFARYEASMFRSPFIETEHFLLGILREDKSLFNKLNLPLAAVEEFRKQIKPGTTRTSTSVDLPLSLECKQAIAYAAEDAEKLHAENIDCEHLLLGLLRLKDCLAATLLQPHGIEYATFRPLVAAAPARPSAPPVRPIERPSAWQETPIEATATSLLPAIASLQQFVDGTIRNISGYSETYGDQPLKRKPWTRKEALGHLIDHAAALQQALIRALTEPKLVAPGYPQDEWVAAQQYRSFSWFDTVDLWVTLNRLLIHVLAQIPESKLTTPCRIGIAAPIPLLSLIEQYIAHSEDILGQILSL